MNYIIKKFILLLITLFFVSLLIFISFTILPGDAVQIINGIDIYSISSNNNNTITNKQLFNMYIEWVLGLLKGDLGISIKYNEPVINIISRCIVVTFWISTISLIIILLLSIPIGILMAINKGSFLNTIFEIINQMFISVPLFFLGIIFIYFLGIILHINTITKYVDYKLNFIGFIQFIILPSFIIALPQISIISKLLSTSIKAQLPLNYVKTALSKGNSYFNVIIFHVLKNASIPLITIVGFTIVDIFTGSLIIEQLFNIPGIGKLLISSIHARDFFLAESIVMYIATIVLLLNFIIDILYKTLDPRINLK